MGAENAHLPPCVTSAPSVPSSTEGPTHPWAFCSSHSLSSAPARVQDSTIFPESVAAVEEGQGWHKAGGSELSIWKQRRGQEIKASDRHVLPVDREGQAFVIFGCGSMRCRLLLPSFSSSTSSCSCSSSSCSSATASTSSSISHGIRHKVGHPNTIHN